MNAAGRLASLQTPSLVLDETIMLRNIARLDDKLARLGVAGRPHLKTVKSVDAARRVMRKAKAATVSTLREAEVFFDAGIKDILYCVGITPQKLPRVLALHARGCEAIVILDSLAQAHAVAEASRAADHAIPVLIEIDCDGHRSGLNPDDPALVEIGRVLARGGAELRGVITHAGESYGAHSEAELVDFAERERDAVLAAARALKDVGLPCPVRSVGSTPTAHFARDLSGVTEVRAGVYVLFDLVQAGIGVCRLEDIAVSVLTTVIGHQRERGWIMIDAGWMALSRDRGTASQQVDQGYGVVCDIEGRALGGLIVTGTNQEHGIVTLRPGASGAVPDIPVGTMLRILPNHACATAAQFDGFEVLTADGGLAHWPRFRGW
ncbi:MULTISPECIES: DSD1 family PLP-dependent enzyme [Hyphomicrobiales]|jgi:D-serine deaminase-like pyridoxal phosphate-dependent protein|uniref:DSD1 family PLP-dependent enzyme n=1 Tax=Hyphomicrobiales TaxID=356 RepID=UPI0003748230|nr:MULTISPECIES: DSD1 family PLP-dependent enzyme [Phyllobacteriaceae]MCX8569546.1 DSD1 family PLP-dependent enzyme [Aminobacter sp. MET-1]